MTDPKRIEHGLAEWVWAKSYVAADTGRTVWGVFCRCSDGWEEQIGNATDQVTAEESAEQIRHTIEAAVAEATAAHTTPRRRLCDYREA